MSVIENKICYIVAACRDFCDGISFSPDENDIVIAADGGYDILKCMGIEPNILLGDFDSISQIPSHKNVIKHPVEKDDTDTYLAYKLGWEKGYRNFVIIGGIGGRLDHTVANLQTIANIAHQGGRGFLVGNDAIITSISNSRICFSDEFYGNISVFAQGGIAENVSICGLKYCVDNISLKPDVPLGVSNEFIGKRAEISVKNGTLMLIWQIDSLTLNIKSFLI